MVALPYAWLLPLQVVAEFDLDAIALQRGSWGLFRDRRPDLYDVLLTKDGDVSSLKQKHGTNVLQP
jgi:hypothetical protein